MATNLLKRLESSVNSFRLTLGRIKDYIEQTLSVIGRKSDGAIDVTTFTDDLDSTDSENDPFVGKKSKINLRDIDVVRWSNDLRHDLDTGAGLQNVRYACRDFAGLGFCRGISGTC